MSQSAHVTSIEALSEFKTAFLVFCEEAKDALGAAEMEARRTIEWIGREQVGRWQRAIRKCDEDLTQAKADLFRKSLDRLTGDIPDLIEEKKTVRRAEEGIRYAQDKLKTCKDWLQKLPRAVGEYHGPARGLSAMVEGEPPQAVILLDRIIASLDAYVGLAPAPGPGTPAAPKIE